MKEYGKIEIDTAKNLMAKGCKWLARDEDDTLFAFREKPYKDETVWIDDNRSYSPVCSSEVPLFQDIKWDDKEPVSLESIIHPPILDDAERRYLERVLKPLPEVRCIRKVEEIAAEHPEHLVVEFVNRQVLCFPTFEMGTMYKGMIGGINYTPEELKLNLEGKA